MDEKRRVAVFDVDGTIFRSSLLIQVVEQLIRDGIFPEKAREIYERQHTLWLDREDGYQPYIDAVVEAFETYMPGVTYEQLVESARHAIEHQWKRIYRYPRDLITTLKSDGYFLLAISHSPKQILDEFCPRLGFDKVYGLVYDVDAEGKFTGSVTDKDMAKDKSRMIQRAVEKESLTLSGSIGMGDTESDIAFLELVENPICFNPNSKLYSRAQKEGWKVVVERKDVIYEL